MRTKYYTIEMNSLNRTRVCFYIHCNGCCYCINTFYRSASQEAKDREFEEYRRRKYGDSRDWGKVSAGQINFSRIICSFSPPLFTILLQSQSNLKIISIAEDFKS